MLNTCPVLGTYLQNHKIAAAAGRIRRVWVKKNSLKWLCSHWTVKDRESLAELLVFWALILPRNTKSILATEAQLWHTLSLGALRNLCEERTSLS